MEVRHLIPPTRAVPAPHMVSNLNTPPPPPGDERRPPSPTRDELCPPALNRDEHRPAATAATRPRWPTMNYARLPPSLLRLPRPHRQGPVSVCHPICLLELRLPLPPCAQAATLDRRLLELGTPSPRRPCADTTSLAGPASGPAAGTTSSACSPPPPPYSTDDEDVPPQSNLLDLFNFFGLSMVQYLIQMKLVCLNLITLSN
jgi:hypothetical protein